MFGSSNYRIAWYNDLRSYSEFHPLVYVQFDASVETQYVLCIPNKDSLALYQLTNDVA